MAELAYHRITVGGLIVTVVRERLERRLDVVTTTRPDGDVWAIYFHAPADVDLDFLHPDVLPPVVPREERPTVEGGAC